MKHANGYVERSSIDTSSTSRIKNAEFVFRIPVGELDGFAAFVESSANVLNKTQGGDDVTVQYFDTESRLQSLRIQQERVTAILEQATKISDILEIESELTRIRTEIEELTTTLRRLDNLTDYATVTVYISEVDVYEPAAGNTFGAKDAGGAHIFSSLFLGSDSGDLRSLCVDFTVPDCRCSHCYRHTPPPPRKPQEESPSSGAADAGGAERIQRPQSAQYNRLTEHAYGDRDTIVCNEGLAQKCQPFMFRFWISVRQFDIIGAETNIFCLLCCSV